jgi:DNA topoisomerase IB
VRDVTFDIRATSAIDQLTAARQTKARQVEAYFRTIHAELRLDHGVQVDGTGTVVSVPGLPGCNLEGKQLVPSPPVREVVAQLKRRRGGPDLLAYKRGRAWVDVRSEDINAYIKEQTGGDFTAKDFRTWTATVLASVALASSFPQARSKTARARAISRAVKEVAHYLGNTPAVCRASYIDPRVFDRYRSGLTVADALEQLGQVGELGEPAHQGPIEEAVLDLIEEKHGPAPELDLIA